MEDEGLVIDEDDVLPDTIIKTKEHSKYPMTYN